MSTVVLDEATLAKLRNGIEDSVKIVDESGKLRGYFYPEDASDYEGVQPTISEAEARRRIAKGGGRSLNEILADLEKRP